MADNEVSLTIDGYELTVPKGTLLIRAAEQLQITIPRFCDHPLLDPVAACRQCLVEVEGQRKPMTACSTQAMDGMVVKTHLSSDVARCATRAVSVRYRIRLWRTGRGRAASSTASGGT
jgi:NADH-quinone oxidoreductase subunit G